jgi:hypothetical protein
LLFFLVLFGAPAVLAAAREVNRTLELSPTGRVFVDTYKGSVRVSTWDSPRVEIRARIEPDGNCDTNEERVRDTEVRIDSSPDSIRIRSDYDKIRRNSGLWGLFQWNCEAYPFVHYSLKIPRTASLKIKDYKSEIMVSDLRSDLQIESYKGTMAVTGLDGSLDLETYKGEARIEFTRLGGKSRMDTYKGDIRISMPRSSRFDLDADFGRRGEFHSDFSLNMNTQGTRGRHERLRSSVNGGGPLLYLKTYKGALRLRQR